MRTLVVSDLHLGIHTGVDVLRDGPALEALADEISAADRIVLLGDVIELRSGPSDAALELAAPALRRLGAAIGELPVLVVPGNHDHALIAPWLDRRDAAALGLEQRVAPQEASHVAARLAELLGAPQLEFAYPGVWLRADVYATHGHYLDCHITVPTIERLAIGAMGRIRAGADRELRRPADYERLLAPIYAWINAVAQTGRGGQTLNGGLSARAWRSLRAAPATRSAGGVLRARALAAAVPLAIAGLNRAGLGPLRAELSGRELRRAGLRAMGQVARQLAIDAEHIVFGHTHRAGPVERDDPAEWTAAAGGPRLHNTGSWIVESVFGAASVPDNPYGPGWAVLVEDDGSPPRTLRILRDATAIPRPAGDL